MRTRAWIVLCAACVACNDADTTRGLAGGEGQFAVVSSNYMGATTISLLTSDGEVSKPEWVGSKTDNPELRTPLSDDVVLPSTSPSDHHLTTIERSLGVVTRFALDDGAVVGQLRTDASPGDDDEGAYHSNPQDVYYANEHSAWVSRWAQNRDPDAADSERGTDLIEFDPATMKRGDRRIDLTSLNEEIDERGFDKDGNSTGTHKAVAYASPSSLVPVGKYLAVGITGITDSYSYGPGKLAIVDLDQAKLVSTLALDDVVNCAEVRPIADDHSSVLVACVGAYGDEGARSGLFKVAVDGAGNAEITHAYRIAEHAGAANTNSNVASLGGDLVVAVATGVIDPSTMKASSFDALYRVDLATGSQDVLRESSGAFAIGVPAFDPSTGVLLVPDAGGDDDPRYGVHRFQVDSDAKAGQANYQTFIEVAPDTTLAARQVLRL
jgi:hypothetical protein